jgi:hypothetical protein
VQRTVTVVAQQCQHTIKNNALAATDYGTYMNSRLARAVMGGMGPERSFENIFLCAYVNKYSTAPLTVVITFEIERLCHDDVQK